MNSALFAITLILSLPQPASVAARKVEHAVNMFKQVVSCETSVLAIPQGDKLHITVMCKGKSA